MVDQMIFVRGSQLAELESNIRRTKQQEGVNVIEEDEYSLYSIMSNQNRIHDDSNGPPMISPVEMDDIDMQSVADSDRPMTASIILGDDDETRAGFGMFIFPIWCSDRFFVDDDSGGILNDDLALSDDEDEETIQQRDIPDSDLTTDDEMTRDNINNLETSNMNQAGQLSNDLALSSSSDEDSEIISSKRLKLDNNDLHTL